MTRVITQRVYNGTNPFLLEVVPVVAHRILDIGCGTGGNAEALAARGKLVDGVTLSRAEADAARPHCRRVCVHDLESGLPPDMTGPYDACIASHVLEHLRSPALALRAIHERLASGGVLLVALPNLLFWKNRLQILFGRFEYEESGIMDSDHVKFYTVRSARSLLETFGFRVEATWAQGWLPIGGLRHIVGRRISERLDSWAASTFPGLFGWQLFLRGVKGE